MRVLVIGTASALCLLSVALAPGCGSGNGSPAMSLDGVSPSAGSADGGTLLTLSGAYLREGSTILVGEVPATDIVPVSDSTCTCRTPPGDPGATVDVTIAAGEEVATLPGAFVYYPRPTLDTVAPISGGTQGGTALLLTGTGFDVEITGVTIGGEPATSPIAVDEVTCSCITPPAAFPGLVDVTITTRGGSATLAAGFAYYPPPTLGGVAPGSDFAAGGARLLVTGTGFTANAAGTSTVTVGGTAATDIVVHDDTSLSCTAPAGIAGAARVVVANGNGSAELGGSFTYFGYPPRLLPSEIRLDTDDPGAAYSRDARICSHGQNIYVVWQDSRSGEWEVYFNRSTDAGATWLADDLKLNAETASESFDTAPQICCEGENVYVVWQDWRDGEADIRFNCSADAGQTWLEDARGDPVDVRLDAGTPGSENSADPRICCGGPYIHVVWVDWRGEAQTVYYNRSTDLDEGHGIDTWLPTDVAIPGSGAGDEAPRVSARGDNVYVVWQRVQYADPQGPGDPAYYRNVLFNGSTDGGATWGTSAVQLDTGGEPDDASPQPQITCDDSNVYVVWRDPRSGAGDIYLNRSTDSGATWLDVDIRLDTDGAGASESSYPQICCDASNVYVCWRDERDGESDIYFNRSTDSGDTWLVDDARLDTHWAGSSPSYGARIACEGKNVFVVWSDGRNGADPDIYLNCSLDEGTTWLTSDVRLDTDFAGAANSSGPQICCDGTRLFVVWRDNRNGNYDILFTTTTP